MFKHRAGCLCALYNENKPPCGYVEEYADYLNHFSYVCRVNETEVAFKLYAPAEACVPENAIQVWNFKTNQIRKVVFSQEIEKIKCKQSLLVQSPIFSLHYKSGRPVPPGAAIRAAECELIIICF